MQKQSASKRSRNRVLELVIERAKRNTNGDLTSYSFHGTMQYSMPEKNAVYSDTSSRGRRIKDTSTQP